MEPVTQLYPLLQAAFLGFALLTGGPPLVVGHGVALIAASKPKAEAEQAAATATPVPEAPAAAAPAAPAPAAPPAPAHGAVAGPAPAAPPAPVPAPPAVAAPAPSKKLKGLAAWSVMVGNTSKGQSDGEELYEFYAKNGTVKQMVGEDKASGKWVLKGETVCFDYDNGDGETCYSVSVSGSQVTFTDEDDNDLTYEILAGNAKKL